MTNNLSLLSSLNRVETPFISCKIGDFIFGVYSKNDIDKSANAKYDKSRISRYPNYLKSLDIKKINGTVNRYTLQFSYPITEKDDPNFFDKVFSSVSKTRKIVFSYGDLSTPTFIYRDEEATMFDIRTVLTPSSAVINYTVEAISSAILGSVGAFNFPKRFEQPSVVIEELLTTEYFGLTQIFTGMKDLPLVRAKGLIPHDDAKVELEMQTNISVLDYLIYLVNCMRPNDTSASENKLSGVYVLNIIDQATQFYTDESGNKLIFDGPYFKVTRNDVKANNDLAYTIDVGFPSQNLITGFSIENNENYSILYDYQNEINNSDFVNRLDKNGNPVPIYAPVISSKNAMHKTTEYDKIWWTKMTEYPIKLSITLKGLLRPAILMSYVRLNTYFWGNKYAAGSGLFIITSQHDQINEQGYRTTLTMTRVGKDT